MKIRFLYLLSTAILVMFLSANNTTQDITNEEQARIEHEVLHAFAQKIFTNAMEAKRAFRANELREDLISNFSTTAPRSEFIVNADISEELASGVVNAGVYVSTDNQNSWQYADVTSLNSEGYENTWGGTVMTNDGPSSYAYIAGEVNSEVLGESFGNIIVSGSPHNVNGDWPPVSNMYADLVDEPSGDASSDQDITSLKATYQGSTQINSDGEEYVNVDRFYTSMGISGGCCDPGGDWIGFGPWFLYGVGIVNPESESDVAYAIGYGDGGFGQLTPGLLKITGDLATGEIGGFEYLTTNISYSTSGNDLQATALMSYITDDADWGTWPNSYNGFIMLGITVEIDGLTEITADIKDETNPGLFICNTAFQDGNYPLTINNPVFDNNSNTLSISYNDADGNLPWFKAAQICNTPENGGNCFTQLDMIPDSHNYQDGVVYSAHISDDIIETYSMDGNYEAHFWFADDDIENYPNAQIELDINVNGSGGCALLGDSNEDGVLNVLDVVLLVNIILGSGEAGNCADINSDGTLNVLDVVLLVNIILG